MVASPEQAHSADVPARMITKAPPVVAPAPQWEWFLEGAGFTTGGEPVWTEVPFFQARSFKPRFGWEGAAGFDYRFANSPWHVSAQIRYGAAKADNRRFFQSGCVFIFCSTSDAAARHKERHWAADFMVGRDLGIGQGQHQVKVGVRVAELNATTDASGRSTSNIFGFLSNDFTHRSDFRGVGPRAALEGSHPLGGAWSFDYGVGVAVLFGDRDFALNGSRIILGMPVPTRIPSSDTGKVYNLDAMGGLSYQFTPNFKFTAGYRFDGYWNVLHTWNSDFEFVNADRFFHGPFARATARY